MRSAPQEARDATGCGERFAPTSFLESVAAARVAELNAQWLELVNAAAVVENVLRSYAEDQREDVPDAKALDLVNHLRIALAGFTRSAPPAARDA